MPCTRCPRNVSVLRAVGTTTVLVSWFHSAWIPRRAMPFQVFGFPFRMPALPRLTADTATNRALVSYPVLLSAFIPEHPPSTPPAWFRHNHWFIACPIASTIRFYSHYPIPAARRRRTLTARRTPRAPAAHCGGLYCAHAALRAHLAAIFTHNLFRPAISWVWWWDVLPGCLRSVLTFHRLVFGIWA